ncbi:hypothetical protein V6N12_015773 [Hibiscus sabdariffa]|uniref:Uncharacterized protein n=1 Tax=Hibiscus sabdariffa TaxID=183260 RepID=A0ABR2DP55_9ROSI
MDGSYCLILIGQPVTVKAAANLIEELSCNSNPVEANLNAGGWDKFQGGKIYRISRGGVQIDEHFAVGGEYLFIGFAVLILQHREWIELSDMLEP